MGACDGCLGNRSCWVCQGSGLLAARERRLGSQPCHRCEGSGICELCGADTIEQWKSQGKRDPQFPLQWTRTDAPGVSLRP